MCINITPSWIDFGHEGVSHAENVSRLFWADNSLQTSVLVFSYCIFGQYEVEYKSIDSILLVFDMLMIHNPDYVISLREVGGCGTVCA